MTPEDFQRVAELFEEARQRDAADRSAFLNEACADAPEIRAEVDSLLAHHDDDSVALVGSAAQDLVQRVADQVLSDELSGKSPGQIDPVGGSDAEVFPERVGPYTILTKIGEGGMGTVYKARQENPKRTVALKVIRPGAISRKALKRFELEAHMLGQLQHVGIAQIFEAGTADGNGGVAQPFLAMEYIDGQRFTDYAEVESLSVSGRLDLFARICDAVQHAHEQGIVHRDLKPCNILVDKTGQPKVLDFGVARATDSDIHATTMRTDMGQLIGTIPYMSPEQVTGDSGTLDARSDVYALGVLLYRLLAGQLPYELEHQSIPEAIQTIQTVEPVKLSAVQSVFRGDVDTIVSKALEKDRTRRYQSAAELAVDIRRHLRHEPIVARPASAIYQFRKFARRNKTLVTSLAVIMVILVAGTVISTTLAIRATDAEHLARLRLDEAVAAKALAEEKQQEAERQGRIAQAVNEFLNDDLLASVDPENTSDRKITMREVLDRAASKVEGAFEGEPLVEAAIRVTIGKTYRSMGTFDVSIPHLQRAYELRGDVLGRDHEDTVDAANELAIPLTYSGQYEKAEPLLLHALDRQKRILGEEDARTLTAMNNVAFLYYSQGRLAEAEPIFLELLETSQRVYGDEDGGTLDAMNNLGMLYFNRQEFQKAEPLYVRALALKRKVLGGDHPRTLDSMNNLAQLYHRQRLFEKAEPLYKEALETDRRVLGIDHPRSIQTLRNLGDMYRMARRYEDALPLCAELVEVLQNNRGEADAETLVAMNLAADTYYKLGRYNVAIALHQKTLALRKEVLGTDHPDALISMSNLAATFRAADRFEEAESMGIASLAAHRRVFGDEHKYTGLAANGLGLVYANQDRHADAELHFRRALSIRAKKYGERHRLSLMSLLNVARSVHNQGRHDDALLQFERAMTLAPGSLSKDDTLLASIHAHYGDCLTSLGRFEEGEAQLLAAYELLQGSVGDKHRRTITVVRFLVDLYEDWGRADYAARWRDRVAN